MGASIESVRCSARPVPHARACGGPNRFPTCWSQSVGCVHRVTANLKNATLVAFLIPVRLEIAVEITIAAS